MMNSEGETAGLLQLDGTEDKLAQRKGNTQAVSQYQ